jgi:hypothetical protein
VPQGIDDFTIVLPEGTDLATSELNVYDGLNLLWRMVERYKMTAPITIRIIDSLGRCIRTIRGTRDQTSAWQLKDESTKIALPLGNEVALPLTINSQDAKGNVLKMRVQFGIALPDPVPIHSNEPGANDSSALKSGRRTAIQ